MADGSDGLGGGFDSSAGIFGGGFDLGSGMNAPAGSFNGAGMSPSFGGGGFTGSFGGVQGPSLGESFFGNPAASWGFDTSSMDGLLGNSPAGLGLGSVGLGNFGYSNAGVAPSFASNLAQALMSLAKGKMMGLAAGKLGVPSMALNAVVSGIQGKATTPTDALNGLFSTVSPALGLANFGLSAFGQPSLGSMAAGFLGNATTGTPGAPSPSNSADPLSMIMSLYGLSKAGAIRRQAGLPSSDVTQLPGYQAGLQAVERRMNAQGFQGSGNMMTELAKYGGDAYNQAATQRINSSNAQMGPLVAEMSALGLLRSSLPGG